MICSMDCFRFPLGTTVVVTPAVKDATKFVSWTLGPCRGKSTYACPFPMMEPVWLDYELVP